MAQHQYSAIVLGVGHTIIELPRVYISTRPPWSTTAPHISGSLTGRQVPPATRAGAFQREEGTTSTSYML